MAAGHREVMATGMYVRGDVSDTAFRPVSGARIEVLDGKYAGANAISNGTGLFELSGTASGVVRLRASHPGFQTATIDAVWQPGEFVRVDAVSTETHRTGARDRAWTLYADHHSDLATATGRVAPCEGFPADLTTRTFEGTIQVSTSPTYAYLFAALPTNPTLNRYTGRVALGVAGQFIGFQSDDSLFSEELPGFRYLQILGSAPTSVPATLTVRPSRSRSTATSGIARRHQRRTPTIVPRCRASSSLITGVARPSTTRWCSQSAERP